MEKLIIEARVNEYTMRDPNPHVPWTADEIARDAAECREAGAAILHFHARQADGSPDFGFEAFRDAILAARERSDMLVHPTLGYGRLDASAEERMDNIVRLAADPRTRPDFAPMDMGSTNVDWYDPQERRYRTKGMIYSNGTDTLEHFAHTIRKHEITPYLTSWNVGFTRQIGAFLDMGLLEAPAYICLSLTEGPMLAGHPGTAEGLDAATAFLPRDHQVEWTVCVFGGDLLPLAAKIIREGGHISIGTGDYGYAEYGKPTNAELVRRIAELSRELGRDVATPEEARQILAPPRVKAASLAAP
jgi:3-keto-5-aminohexanoate cleavage enzyme